MISKSEVLPHTPCVRAQLEPAIAKMQLKNIPKLYKALGYSVEIQTINEGGKIIHKIICYRGGSATPFIRRMILIEELGE